MPPAPSDWRLALARIEGALRALRTPARRLRPAKWYSGSFPWSPCWATPGWAGLLCLRAGRTTRERRGCRSVRNRGDGRGTTAHDDLSDRGAVRPIGTTRFSVDQKRKQAIGARPSSGKHIRACGAFGADFDFCALPLGSANDYCQVTRGSKTRLGEGGASLQTD